MSDYAASPVQPILQGLVTVIPQEVGLPLVSFYGRGCKAVVADVTGVLLTLDGGIAGTRQVVCNEKTVERCH